MATIKEIAALAGVSRGTVDRVLNKRGYVSDKNRAAVTRIIEEVGYTPDSGPRSAAFRKKNITIAYVYRDSGLTHFFDAVIAGMRERIAALSDYKITLETKRVLWFDAEGFVEALDGFEKSGADGFIVTPFDDDAIRAKMNELCAAGLPVFTCNVDISGTKRLAFAGCDLYKAGRVAGGLISLLNGGRADVGIVSSSNLPDRIRGFRDAVVQNHPDVKIADEVFVEEDIDKVYNASKMMLARSPHINAVFADTIVVVPVSRALSDAGLAQKVSIVCFDDIPSIRKLILNGSVAAIVYQNPGWQGAQAVSMLWNYLLNRRLPVSEINYSVTEVRIRESF